MTIMKELEWQKSSNWNRQRRNWNDNKEGIGMDNNDGIGRTIMKELE